MEHLDKRVPHFPHKCCHGNATRAKGPRDHTHIPVAASSTMLKLQPIFIVVFQTFPIPVMSKNFGGNCLSLCKDKMCHRNHKQLVWNKMSLIVFNTYNFFIWSPIPQYPSKTGKCFCVYTCHRECASNLQGRHCLIRWTNVGHWYTLWRTKMPQLWRLAATRELVAKRPTTGNEFSSSPIHPRQTKRFQELTTDWNYLTHVMGIRMRGYGSPTPILKHWFAHPPHFLSKRKFQ